MSLKSTSQLAPGPLALTGLIVLAALSRLLPHPFNFSPIEAIALFGGAHFLRRGWALAVPLLAMLASDLVLGWINGGIYVDYFLSTSFLSIYACIALSCVMGFALRGKATFARIAGFSVLGSVLFFLATNFAVWASAQSLANAPACSAGLGACYVAGLPFFKNTLLGTLFYALVLFGSFAWMRGRIPALRAQTA